LGIGADSAGEAEGLLVVLIPFGREIQDGVFPSLGYTSGHWKRLENDIRAILRNYAICGECTDYGQKFEVRGNMIGPAGKTALIVTAWIVLEGEEIPRFVTAYPGDSI
jgi:hypothetical protein